MTNTKEKKEIFKFKQFEIQQDQCTMKVGTDGVILGAYAPVGKAKKILDIGAGTGLVALMLAQRTKKTKVVGVEIEKKAFEQAAENGKNSPWANRISFENDSIQDYSKFADDEFDLIVSNPPFFSGGTFSDNQEKNNVRHTIKLPNGDLLSAARKLLSPKGKFCVILPYMEGLRFTEMAKNYRLFCSKIVEIRGKASKPEERLILIFEQEEVAKVVEKDLVVYNEDGSYTDAFIELTKEFYLKF